MVQANYYKIKTLNLIRRAKFFDQKPQMYDVNALRRFIKTKARPTPK